MFLYLKVFSKAVYAEKVTSEISVEKPPFVIHNMVIFVVVSIIKLAVDSYFRLLNVANMLNFLLASVLNISSLFFSLEKMF